LKRLPQIIVEDTRELMCGACCLRVDPKELLGTWKGLRRVCACGAPCTAGFVRRRTIEVTTKQKRRAAKMPGSGGVA
jgi:hypothetical protein